MLEAATVIYDEDHARSYQIRIPNSPLFEDALRSLRRRAAPVIQTASRLDHRIRTPHRLYCLIKISVYKCTAPGITGRHASTTQVCLDLRPAIRVFRYLTHLLRFLSSRDL